VELKYGNMDDGIMTMIIMNTNTFIFVTY